MSGRVVAVEGPSASGKSRVVRDVAAHLGALRVAEAYDRLHPRPALRWRSPDDLLRLERRLLAEDVRRSEEARREADAGRLVLADTGFLGTITYTWGLVRLGEAPPRVLASLLATARRWEASGRWSNPDAVVYLRTSSGERRRRAAGDPAGHPVTIQDRHQRVAAQELLLYRTVLRPAFGPRLRYIRGDGTKEEVAGRMVRALRGRPDRSTALPSLRIVLGNLEAAGRSVTSRARV